jgi:hypothetical protein
MSLRKILTLTALLGAASAPALALQATAVEGAWRNPAGGTCDAPFFRAGDASKSTRGETAIKATIVNAGQTIVGDLVLEGMRRGQFVSPMTDRAVFLVDTPQGRVRVIPMALEYRSWGENGIVLEKCQ